MILFYANTEFAMGSPVEVYLEAKLHEPLWCDNGNCPIRKRQKLCGRKKILIDKRI